MSNSFDHDKSDLRRLISELASIIAHDVRTPIRHVNQFLDFYEEDLSKGHSDQAEEHMRVVRSSLKEASDMIDGLISYARLGRGLGPPEPFNLRKLAETALERASLTLNTNQAHLIFEGEETGFGHASRVQDMFTHLFENAIMFGPKDRPVEINLAVQKEAADLKIWISDNGPGIPKGYEDSVFDLFQRFETGHDQQGIGLGLALSRRIAELHGGTLTIESSVDQEPELSGGLTLLCRLPG